MTETKDFCFEIKAVNEDGTFEGFAAVYGNVDLGGDVIEPGAFTKTIAERGAEVPILWQHDPRKPIGIGKLEDSPVGLKMSGKLLVSEVQQAREAHALLKAGIVKGLSIGYDAVKKSILDGIRHLTELKLWEVSTVTFPMNELALVNSVKSVIAEAQDEIKAGRALSAATLERLRRSHTAMRQAMDELSALMTTSEEEAGKSAAKKEPEPDLHSAFNSLIDTLKKFSA